MTGGGSLCDNNSLRSDKRTDWCNWAKALVWVCPPVSQSAGFPFMTENTKLALRSVRYKISPHSVQSRHRSAICSTNCGPLTRESNLSFWLDHQSLFLSPSLPPLVNWTSAGLLKPRRLSHSLSPHENNRGTCERREPGESFTVQMLPVRRMLCSHSHCFPAQSSGWDAYTNTHLFSTLHKERLGLGKCLWEEKNKTRCMIERHPLRHSFQNREREKDGQWNDLLTRSIGAPM